MRPIREWSRPLHILVGVPWVLIVVTLVNVVLPAHRGSLGRDYAFACAGMIVAALLPRAAKRKPGPGNTRT